MEDINKLIGEPKLETSRSEVVVACYARVSTNDQKKHGDLDRQKLRLLEFCANNNFKVEHILEETSSGMKASRPKLNKLYKLVINKEIDKVIIEYKDRLTRFMFEVFKEFFNSYDVEIICVEKSLPRSFESELVEDILSIITSFSARLYSRRNRQSREFRKKNGLE